MFRCGVELAVRVSVFFVSSFNSFTVCFCSVMFGPDVQLLFTYFLLASLLTCEPDSVREKMMCLFIKLLHSDTHMNMNAVKLDRNGLILWILPGFQWFYKHISLTVKAQSCHPHSHSSHLRKTPSFLFRRELTSSDPHWLSVHDSAIRHFFFTVITFKSGRIKL